MGRYKFVPFFNIWDYFVHHLAKVITLFLFSHKVFRDFCIFFGSFHEKMRLTNFSGLNFIKCYWISLVSCKYIIITKLSHEIFWNTWRQKAVCCWAGWLTWRTGAWPSTTLSGSTTCPSSTSWSSQLPASLRYNFRLFQLPVIPVILTFRPFRSFRSFHSFQVNSV